MTEYTRPYQLDQAPLGTSQERLVFVDPADRHAREFEIAAARAHTQPTYGADSPEVNQAVEAAYSAVYDEREEAAARTAENAATDAELAQAIDYNALTMKITRDAKVDGLI